MIQTVQKDRRLRLVRTAWRFATLLLVCGLLVPLTNAQTLRSQSLPVAKEIEVDVRGVKIKIADVMVTDQDGRKVRFYSDLIKDKVVVLSFFYTSCSYICVGQGKVFSELQSLLGDRLGKSVFLISVTTDPGKDTAERLRVWGKRNKRRAGWTLVTGEDGEMNKLLTQFTGNKAGGGMHIPVTFIANDRAGLWTSRVGSFGSKELIKVVDQINSPLETSRTAFTSITLTGRNTSINNRPKTAMTSPGCAPAT